MTTSNDPASRQNQRDALMESEKKANEKQPANVKDEALKDKIVEIKPDASGDAPIQGLDTK